MLIFKMKKQLESRVRKEWIPKIVLKEFKY